MKRDFDKWFSNFKDSIADYSYYVNFDKVHQNMEEIKVELNILNSLIGSQEIENDFRNILTKYPEVLKCIPILLAVRSKEIQAIDEDGTFIYSFNTKNQSIEQYILFMKKTGLFDLLERRILNNLVDYVTGVETGLDSNGRKNRGGHLMENIVENFLIKSGLKKDYDFFKEMNLSEVESKWGVDLSSYLKEFRAEKRFDFIVKINDVIYAIETNFYKSGGSKLNETARSYKTLALESDVSQGFTFMWITDGHGWVGAKNNLRETFNTMEHLYNIHDMENEVFNNIFFGRDKEHQ